LFGVFFMKKKKKDICPPSRRPYFKVTPKSHESWCSCFARLSFSRILAGIVLHYLLQRKRWSSKQCSRMCFSVLSAQELKRDWKSSNNWTEKQNDSLE
jgi:hypothetical protein